MGGVITSDELGAESLELQLARKTEEFQAVYQRKSPLVSVCVATFNRSELLIERCIKSLQRQTYPNIQIIVVGDHCTDGTEYFLAKLNDSRIVFENLPVRGPYPPPGRARWAVAGSNAMNRALQLVEGDFVMHLDDDDEATINRVEKMLEESLESQAEFLWHQFSCPDLNGVYGILGNPELIYGQVTTGSTFYHNYFTKCHWDVEAYKANEPGDWHRLQRIKLLNPKLQFVNEMLTIHYREGMQSAFKRQWGERFL